MRRLPDRIDAAEVVRVLACEHRAVLDRLDEPVSGGPARLPDDGSRRRRAALLDALRGPAADLRGVAAEDREDETRRAVGGMAPLILGARIGAIDMTGAPPALRLDPIHGYVAVEVDAGAPGDRAAQIATVVRAAHHAAILARLRWGSADRARAIIAAGIEVDVDLGAPRAPHGPPAALHAKLLARARLLRNGAVATRPSACAACPTCPWRVRCGTDAATSRVSGSRLVDLPPARRP